MALQFPRRKPERIKLWRDARARMLTDKKYRRPARRVFYPGREITVLPFDLHVNTPAV